MDHPDSQVTAVIRALCQGDPATQEAAVNNYFLPNAYLIHPFCRVPSFGDFALPTTSWTVNSRWLLLMIYRWYRTLSPEIQLEIDSIAWDKSKNHLFASIRQTFTLWFVPFALWRAHVQLVTVLELAHLPVDDADRPVVLDPAAVTEAEEYDPDALQADHHRRRRRRYFIQGQEDHYQPEQFVRFVAPFAAGLLWMAWQLFAAGLCVLGVVALYPAMAARRVLRRDPDFWGGGSSVGAGVGSRIRDKLHAH
ncbi:hypothetical protein F4780DRAFT_160824 [Xylariomycetidae sp. FL0641]|nr:hypothetical protein F4780DRAFT_160824 [Xylariomycetidae sp. FL0641]